VTIVGRLEEYQSIILVPFSYPYPCGVAAGYQRDHVAGVQGHLDQCLSLIYLATETQFVLYVLY
jgi:hypothetical protein